MSADPRSRTKTWLDYYIDVTPGTATRLGNLLLDDAATAPQLLMQYAKPNYDLDRIMLPTTQGGKGYDLVYNVYTPESTPLHTWNHQTYGYIEKVTIEPAAMTKTGLTGTTLRWQAEQELRRITETYAGGSLGALRRFQRMSDSEEPLGALRLYSVKYELEYKRKNDNFTPTVPYFNYGVGWHYDGDHYTTVGSETWGAVSGGGGASASIDSGDFLKLTRGTADCSIAVTITSLDLTATINTKCSFRYKCETSTKAAIIITGSGGTQTVLVGINTTTLTPVTVSLQASLGTIQTITWYASVAAGSVYFDFMQIYEDNYILPNCTKLTPPVINRDAFLKPPGMIGSHTQSLGGELATVQMNCDLDVEGATITWKRPQTGSPTDKVNTQVFQVILQEEARSVNPVPWHWLNFGCGAMKARLTKMEPDYVENNILNLEWTEYRLSSAGCAHENAQTRFSLDQVT
jgi:hypothetical protein